VDQGQPKQKLARPHVKNKPPFANNPSWDHPVSLFHLFPVGTLTISHTGYRAPTGQQT
jgi:hypothetical protein